MNAPLTPLERLRRSGISPERSLGQNFLIDPNILGVIERSASLSPQDVVLEVGPGLGVLTELLLARCRLVHCVELDRRLADLLGSEFGGNPGFRLHMADAMRLDLGSLDPPPDKFVANLPYNVATPLVIKSLEESPEVGLWCLMVQKEIADRLFAPVGSAQYGGVSVMTQMFTEKISARNISGNVFYPQPRVKSSLLVFRRRAVPVVEATAPGFGIIKKIVYAAFSHRRKKLVNSLAEADPSPSPLDVLEPGDRRRLVERQLDRLGLAATVRAQELTPRQFSSLAAALTDTGERADA